jgi:riboflavin synthase
MFTGIVSGIGRIVEVHALGSGAAFGRALTIEAPAGWLGTVAIGDSIALAGACMTAVSIDAAHQRFQVEVSAESLAATHGLDAAGEINLEKALRAGDRLDGHLVSGHVDGVGTVTRFERAGESWTLAVAAPRALARFLALKGSIAVDGVSLTINAVAGRRFSVNLIPHTLAVTTLGSLAPGDGVNLEVDMVARYVARLQDVG